MTHGAAHGYPISASDLTIEYPPHGASPAFVAVRGFTLDVAPGEVVGLLGAAGSGKSTVANVLAGDHLHDAHRASPVITGGEATVLGYRMRGLGRRKAVELAFDVGHLAQDGASRLTPDRTVAEIVGEPVLLRDQRYSRRALTAKVAAMVDAVRLPLDMMPKVPYELSSGQRQRVALARSLILEPTLLIADDPTAGIDVTVRDAVVDLIGEIQRERAFSALVVSHDLAVLDRIADRIAVLDHGEMVALGTLEEVLDDPIHPYVKRLSEAYFRDIPEELLDDANA